MTTGTVAFARLPSGTYSALTGTGTITTGVWDASFGTTANTNMWNGLRLGNNAQRNVTLSTSGTPTGTTSGDIWIQYVP